MPDSGKHPLSTFWGSVARWSGLVVLLAFASQTLSAALAGEIIGIEPFLLIPGWIGLSLPFTAFAGGVAAGGDLRRCGLLRWGLVVAGLSYGLLAFAAPLADYSIQIRPGTERSLVFPTGPRTPFGLIELRSEIEADPPGAFTFRVEAPLTLPPNWLTYLLHSSATVAIYSLLSVLLGYRSAGLTSGLSPPNRRNARWALGLFFAVAFFVAEVVGGQWVRGDPSRSGILAAWVPLVLPSLLLLALEALAGTWDTGEHTARSDV